ncbi:MAG: nitroreductase [Planctomycetes bacterium GWF2_41_51]|nr:MAG: nitroreductase [Planctomycetes bacterium GWF2_41_51]
MNKIALSIIMILFVYPMQSNAADANSAAEIKSIELPKPVMEGGKPLMEALKDRKSSREFSDEKLSLQVLSNMLWAANGISRPDGKRTAPSARNKQEIDIYVAMEDGLYLYDAKENKLVGIVTEDIREATGMQPFVKVAPVNLVYVADYDKMGDGASEQKDFYAAIDTGYISQNIYLFCSSEGLATVVRGMVDRDKCKNAMKLKDNKKIILAQTVGYPKK